jgi:hypothetical protein
MFSILQVLQSVGLGLDYLCSLDDENIEIALSEFSRKMRSDLYMLRENARPLDNAHRVESAIMILPVMNPTSLGDSQAIELSHTESAEIKAESPEENLDAILANIEEAML